MAERDGHTDHGGKCRICGAWTEVPGLHHIVYKSAGGLDVVSNLITVGWCVGSCDCHLKIAHGANARYWRELLLEIADQPAFTALQVARWVGDPSGLR